MAIAAATEMARTAGVAFNPLMIHSGIGLGKTHLLEGINRSLRRFHPRLQIVQLSAEAFTNGFVESMRTGTLSGFRTRFRSAGGLIVDDIQFLAAKRATMIEFLYTFDALFDKGAPIVLAADQHPRQIERLTDELITRFLAGMVVRIESPDLMTRQAILRAKAASRGVEVPEAVVIYIAEHLRVAFASSRAPSTPSLPSRISPVNALTCRLLNPRCGIQFAIQPSRSASATSNERSATSSR